MCVQEQWRSKSEDKQTRTRWENTTVTWRVWKPPTGSKVTVTLVDTHRNGSTAPGREIVRTLDPNCKCPVPGTFDVEVSGEVTAAEIADKKVDEKAQAVKEKEDAKIAKAKEKEDAKVAAAAKKEKAAADKKAKKEKAAAAKKEKASKVKKK